MSICIAYHYLFHGKDYYLVIRESQPDAGELTIDIVAIVETMNALEGKYTHDSAEATLLDRVTDIDEIISWLETGTSINVSHLDNFWNYIFISIIWYDFSQFCLSLPDDGCSCISKFCGLISEHHKLDTNSQEFSSCLSEAESLMTKAIFRRAIEAFIDEVHNKLRP